MFTKDEFVNFYEPTNKDHVSYSVVEDMKSSNYIQVQVKTLKIIMEELGHDHIDLLKIDIQSIYPLILI